jgi:hypothetical protein
MPQPIPGAPADIAAAIDELIHALTRTAGPNLAGLILYGGLARGRFRPGTSDVNIVVLLRNASWTALGAIAPALQAARRSAGIEPMILTPGEVSAAADVFPTKFLDIKRYHVVLAGDDPFATLDISHEHLRLRIEQELRNMLLRLRRLGIDAVTDPRLLTRSLARTARPLAIELDALLRLSGKSAPPDDHTSVIFKAAAAAFDLNPVPLARLADLRQQPRRPADDLTGLFGDVLHIISRAADLADRMKDPSQ